MDPQSHEVQQGAPVTTKEKAPIVDRKNVWENSVAMNRIRAQADKNKELNNDYGTVIVCSDIDGTMLVPDKWLQGNEEERKIEQQKLNKDAQNVAEWLHKENIPLIYVSGRDHNLIAASEQGPDQLPEADVHIGAVGTEIMLRTADGKWIRDTEYEEYLRTERHFNRSDVWSTDEMATEQFKDLNMRFQARDSLENISAWNNEPENAKKLGLTNEDSPQEFKVSFNFDGQYEDVARVRAYMQEQLSKKGMENLEIVISSNHTQDGVTSFNVDVLPISKEGAIGYVQSKLGADFSIFAGDSGNDPIKSAGNAGIAVGGRKAELDRVIEEERAVSPRKTGHFIMQGESKDEADRIVFADTNEYRISRPLEGPEQPLKRGPSSVSKGLRMFSLLRSLSNTVGRKPVAQPSAVV